MTIGRFRPAFVVCLPSTLIAAQAAPLSDLVPEDAAGAVVVRSLSETGGKVDRFFRDNRLSLPGPLALPPSVLLRAAILEQFKLSKGVDDKSPLAVVWAGAKSGIPAGEEGAVVFAVPFTTLPEFAGNFGIFGLGIRPDLTVQIGKVVLHPRGRHVWIGVERKAVAAVVESAPLTARLSAARKAALEKADLYGHFHPEAMGEGWKTALTELDKQIRAESDAGLRVLGGAFLESLRDLRSVGAAVRIDGGLSISIEAAFGTAASRGGALARSLGLAWADAVPSSTVGLPLLHPLGVYAARLAPDPAAVRECLRAWLEDDPAAKQNPQGRDRLTEALMKLAGTARGLRLVAYRTANAAEVEQIGLVGVIAMIDTDSAEQWLAQTAEAVEAFNKLFGPALTYTARGRAVGGGRMDTLRLEVEGEDGAGLKLMLGPQWNTIRLVPHGNSVVLLIGSDADTLTRTVQGLRSGGRSLADHKALAAAARERLDGRRKAELHLSLRSIPALVDALTAGKPAGGADVVEAVTSAAISPANDRMQIDLWLPNAEIRALLEMSQPARALLGAPGK